LHISDRSALALLSETDACIAYLIEATPRRVQNMRG